MKNLFYGLISFIIILIFYIDFSYDKQLEQPKYNDSIVIEKKCDFVFGYMMYFKYQNDSIVIDKVYQIFYEKYNVGDTVNCLNN